MCGIPRGAIIDQITSNPKQMLTCCNTTTVVVIINSKSIKKKLKSPIWWKLFHLCPGATITGSTESCDNIHVTSRREVYIKHQSICTFEIHTFEMKQSRLDVPEPAIGTNMQCKAISTVKFNNLVVNRGIL